MSLCNEHRFLVSGVITSKPLQHTISMSGHEAFSACDNNSPSKSPSNKSFLVPNLFVWHFSFWTQLQKKTHFKVYEDFQNNFISCTFLYRWKLHVINCPQYDRNSTIIEFSLIKMSTIWTRQVNENTSLFQERFWQSQFAFF